jgi:KDO2-lipid IV(A) lauroyltransferase
METLLYGLARGLVALLQALPLGCLARLGRAGGTVAYVLDARHRRVAWRNLRLVFGVGASPAEIRALARENFCRIGESFACALKTAVMKEQEIHGILDVVGAEKFSAPAAAGKQPNCVVAIGHFGNFELYTATALWAPGFQGATTYRALRQAPLSRLLLTLRERSGCLYFERRTEAQALREALNRGGLVLGLLADQHGGRKGVWGPFFGEVCSTTPAPAVLALRYRCPLLTAICFRVAPGRWRIEIGDAIPTRLNGHARSVAAITADINRAFEAAIRRDPANWFWVHNRWKPPRAARRAAAPASGEGGAEDKPDHGSALADPVTSSRR